jgi:Pretoxin HINT domain
VKTFCPMRWVTLWLLVVFGLVVYAHPVSATQATARGDSQRGATQLWEGVRGQPHHDRSISSLHERFPRSEGVPLDSSVSSARNLAAAYFYDAGAASTAVARFVARRTLGTFRLSTQRPLDLDQLAYDAPHLLRFSLDVVATKARPCPGNSFSYDTEVVMADGSRKAISDLTVGDEVIATDPETGRTAVREVTAVHLNLDTAFTDVTVIDADGDVSTINTTQHHPFWSVSDHKWTDAMDLERGDHLRSADGSLLTVASVRAFEGNQWMWDLTIDDIHTFYVANGEDSVLVHNCDETVCRGAKPGEVVDFNARPASTLKLVPTDMSNLDGAFH